MSMQNITNDKKFIDILNNYSEKQKLGNILTSLVNNTKSKEIIIPVLGMQGMGKSTLINSILSENILPNNADETTCVPVEIKYGEEEKSLVHFKSSDKTVTIFTKDELSEYVDNIHNPGNDKGVSHVVLHRKLEILNKGVTIVDLPGVGSLTKENQDTTMRYIKNLCTAIFVIPTTPTIRRTEEIFIKSVWMQFTSAIFVQNNFGETKREVLESVEFNSKVLKNISKSINTPYDGDIKVVNAYDAICGAINNDEKLRQKSNINDLIDAIKDTANNWENKERENIISRVELTIASCKKQIENLISESKLSSDELHAKLQKEEDIFKSNTKELKKQVENIDDYLYEKGEYVYSFAKEQSKICTENIRSNIYRIIDSGVVDGHQLTEAFNDYQDQYLSDVINNFYDLSQAIKFELLDQMEEFREIIELENDMSIDSLNFNNEQAFKYEKGLHIVIDVAGGIGGIYVGGEMGLAIGSVIGGPIGAVVGGAVGLLTGIGISIVASSIGKKTKKTVTGMRARETKREIDVVIDEIGDTIKKQITVGFDEMIANIRLTLDEYIDERKKQLNEIRVKNIEKLKNEHINNYNLQELEEDYTYLTNRENEINETRYKGEIQYS